MLVEDRFKTESIKLGKKKYYDPRVIGLFVIFSILLIILGIRLTYLQIYKYSHYKTKSETNRLRIIPVSANRGIVFDRNGKTFVGNRTTYSILIYPVKVTQETENKVKILGNALDVKPEQIIKKLNYAGSNSPYPILIKQDVDQEIISYILENRNSLPALTIEPDVIRTHPEKKLASHVLGYTGEINYTELEELKEKGYKVGDFIGKTGVEHTYESVLKGTVGGQYIEVDSMGRKIRTLKTEPSISGKSIYLTLDLNIQKKVESLLEGKNAAAVVMDVNTGEVIAMASKPDYDPNMFYSRISKKDWEELQKLKNPFMNRAISSFPPGSIFKIVTSAAALEEGMLTASRRFNSRGSLVVGGHRFMDWNPKGFGVVDIEKALAYSINTVYYELSLELGIDNIKKYSHMFGLGTKTEVELPSESKGIIPDKEWKRKYWNQPWYIGDTVSASIGQGSVQVSPLQATVMTAATANGGKVLKPRIVKSVDGETSGKIKPVVVNTLDVSKKNMDIVRNGLRSVVKYGTGGHLRFHDLEVAGKTGSAEDPPNKKTHSWVVTYAPYNAPKYAVTVFVQNGGHGGDIAAPIAREIYKELFNLK